MKTIFPLLITLLFSTVSIADSLICATLFTAAEGKDDLRMTEEEFNKEHFLSSLSFFQNELPNRLKNTTKTNSLTRSSEFWISYRNSLKFMEGYMLKQDALIKGKKAKDEFCQFLSKAQYVD